MAVDVTAEIRVQRPRDEVAAYAMDPANDAVWVSGITEARMLTEPPVRKGTRVERIASFLGKGIEYVLEVDEHDPSGLLLMRSVKGPFPMRVTYAFDGSGETTRASIRIQGDASGFYRLAAPLLSRAVKRSITKDLRNLKGIMESGNS